MDYHYARNVTWGQLGVDDAVEVTFDIHDAEGNTIATGLTVKGVPDGIQQSIAEKVRTKSAAVAMYEALITNTEFAIEMTS